MSRRVIVLAALAASILFVSACGSHKERLQEHTFVTDKHEHPHEKQEPEEIAPLLKQDERKAEVPTFDVPEPVRERLAQEIPSFGIERSTKFTVVNQHLKISSKESTMTFTGVLQVAGRPDEPISLSCKFDKSKTWECGDMFPTDPKVARERRLQATVNCLDVYRCDKVGLELFVVIDGRTESRLFQSGKFEIRRASSGDIFEADDDEPLGTPLPETPKTQPPQSPVKPAAPVPAPKGERSKQETKNPSEPKVFEKPTRTLPPPRAKEQEAPILSEEELKEVMDDANAAVDVTTPMPVPAPSRGEFSIPDIEKLRPEIGKGVTNQAIGVHSDGSLREATELPKAGPGFVARARSNRAFGTNLMVDLLTFASAQVATVVPNRSPIVIANISQKTGGKLCSTRSCHKSHQTGLDVDVVFPSHKKVDEMWSVCGSGRSRCPVQGSMSPEFDVERFWLFAQQMTCAEKDPVIAMFIDTEVKKYVCRWVKENTKENINDPNSCAFKTLRAMKYQPGHHNHFHMRLRCPGNRDCRDATVSLGRGSGC